MRSRGFWRELKRRHVYRVAAAYAIVGWLLIQVVTQVFPVFHLPDWIDQAIVLLILIGFPIALLLAWAFDATPHGIVRTDTLSPGADASAPSRRSRRAGFTVGLIGVLIAIAAGAVWWHAESGKLSVPRDTHMASAEPVAAVSATSDGSASTPHGITAAPIAAQPIPAKSVAVLPFENLSADKSNAYFADGMQDLILTKLADIGDLKVISRTSTLQYGSHPENLVTVGEQLGVAAILEGSVQKAGNQVLINVQLIDAKTDSHIWAQSYQRTLDNIFGVEGEVADKVATALNAKLTQAESATVANVPTQNPAAFDDYLRGEHYRSLAMAGNFKTLPEAVDAYRSATEADPKFALAWARLALAQSMLNYASIDVSKATGQQALSNAQRALALAPNLPQAHLALGYVYRFDFHDDDKALAEFHIAQKGLPNNAEVEAAIAYIEDDRGDSKAAAAGLECAVTLDPRNPNLAFTLGGEYAALRQYDRARAAYNRVLAIAPDDPEGYSALARLEVFQSGNVNAALVELDKAPAALESGSEIVDARVNLLLLKRDYPAALRAVAGLQSGGRFVTPARAALLRATVNYFAGNAAEARKDFEQTLALARSAVRSGQTGAGFEIIYAELGLGNKQAAIQTAHQVQESALHSKTKANLYAVQYALAVIDAKYGDAGPAVSILNALLAAPSPGGSISVPLLKLDPTWDPIRHDPRFQALLKQYANTATPATAGNPTSSDSADLHR